VVYLSGTDSRSKVMSTNRSDVNILAVVNPQTQQILLINTPRDSYVPNTAANGALDKLTHCGLFGINCSVSTLENLYGIEIDHFARINFTGFETLIDAIGGVTIHSNIAFKTTHGDYPIVVGENHLNGAQALSYARERYSLPGGERERGKNQMKIITAVIKKMLSGSLITNYAEIMNSLADMFTTNFPQEKISALVKSQLLQMTDWEIFSYATNGTPSSGITYTMPNMELYVLKLSDESVQKGADLIQSVLNGEVITNDDLK
jgi:LCP family protein required for cell wall assembly